MSSFDQFSGFMETVYNSNRNSRFAEQLEGRRMFPTIAIVTDNNDPENRRRIKVSDPIFVQVDSEWIRPLRFTQNQDPPLPQVDQTVMLLFMDGDPLNAYYLLAITDTNPSLAKSDPVLDESYNIEGQRSTTVEKNDNLAIRGDRAVSIIGNSTDQINGTESHTVNKDDNLRVIQNYIASAGISLTLKTDSGASITLTASGQAIIQDAQGRKITLGGSSNCVWDLKGTTLQIINAGDLQVNGNSIATIGAVDSRGDHLTSKGWS